VPELGDVLGGVLADVLRGRVAADALTADLLAAYSQDPSLSMLSVPRVTVKEMTVTLRFAVNQLQSPAPVPGGDPRKETDDWGRVLRERVMPRFVDERLATLDVPERAEMRELLVEDTGEPPAVREESVRAAFEGKPDELVAESTAELLGRVRAVPARMRRGLGTVAELRPEIDRTVRAELEIFLDRNEQLESARRALRSRLDVEIVTDQLQTRPAQVIQELTVTLSMADVENEIIQGS
jgi:hypothetical protein